MGRVSDHPFLDKNYSNSVILDPLDYKFRVHFLSLRIVYSIHNYSTDLFKLTKHFNTHKLFALKRILDSFKKELLYASKV